MGVTKMNTLLKLLNTLQFKEALENAEKEIYLAAYTHVKNNQSEAAKLLGVARGTFIRRLKEWKMLP